MAKLEPVTVAVKSDGKKVILLFNHPVEVWEVDPNPALDIAEAISTAAMECQGMKPVGPALKAQLIEKHRAVLNRRLQIILGGQQFKVWHPERQARFLVDTCLKEVF